MTALWNGAVIAESDATVAIEGNHDFPEDCVRWELLRGSAHTSVCPWKGTASYYDVVVAGRVNRHAVWQYRTPNGQARAIEGRVAFWNGVRVVRGVPVGTDTETAPRRLIQRMFSRKEG